VLPDGPDEQLNPLKLALLKNLLCFALLFIAIRLNAQVDTAYTPSKTYTQTTLISDFQLLKDVLVEAHPSLYRYADKTAVDSAFAKARVQLNREMTEDEFWRVLEPVIVSIHSGHTNLFPSSAAVSWYIKHPPFLLPFFFHVSSDTLFMLRRTKDSTINVISRVKTIDGMAAPEIIHTLEKYVPAEALTNQFVDFQLQGAGFSRVYGQVFGYKPNYTITATDSAGVEKTINLAGIARAPRYSADQFKQLLDNKKKELNKSVSVTYPPDIPATAILKISSLTYMDYFRDFHRNFFKQIQDDKIQNLVIDIRGNTGGFPLIGLDLIRYLVDGSCTEIESEQVQNNKITFNDAIVPNSGYDFPIAGTDEVEPYKYKIRWYNYAHSSDEFNFDKNLYLLIDKGTFSAASVFAASLKKQRRVIVAGEETGGCEAGTDGGFSIVKLPNTGLLLNLPRVWLKAASNNPHSKTGIMPDVPVNTGMPANSKADPVMKKVKELILASKK
jgi:hypothetical protein